MPFFKHSHAQDTKKVSSADVSVREQPKFEGGEEELRAFLSLNLHYPNEAFKNNVQGEVIVRFKIDENGNISDIKALKALGYGCDEEAIRVISSMPKWIPAKRNGKKVAVVYNLPIVFELPKKQPQDASN